MSGQFGIKNTAEVIVFLGAVASMYLRAQKAGFAGNLLEFLMSDEFRQKGKEAFSDITEVTKEIRDIQLDDFFALLDVGISTLKQVVTDLKAA